MALVFHSLEDDAALSILKQGALFCHFRPGESRRMEMDKDIFGNGILGSTDFTWQISRSAGCPKNKLQVHCETMTDP